MHSPRKYFFISGLPRSGSTLFSAIMRQNPAFEAGMTSPVGGITSMLRVAMSNNIEIASLMSDDGRANILRGVFDGYYGHLPSDKIVFDTNRGWTGRIDELIHLFGEDIKIIALIRDPAWIMDSIERIIRANPLRQSKLVAPNSTLRSRAEHLAGQEGLIGSALGHLSNALAGPYSNRVLLLEYDALVSDPEQALGGVYKFLGIPSFDHDFENVHYQQESFDDLLMTPGLHDVSGAVRFVERQTILPLEIFERLSALAFWRGDFQTNAPRIIMQAKR